VIKLLPREIEAEKRKQMLESISIIKEKSKFGKIDRVTNANEILIKDLFNKETGPDVYMNLRVTINLTG
jgi:hypothetical protein